MPMPCKVLYSVVTFPKRLVDVTLQRVGESFHTYLAKQVGCKMMTVFAFPGAKSLDDE